MPLARRLENLHIPRASVLNARWVCAGLVLFLGTACILYGTHSHGNRRAVELMTGLAFALLALAYLAFDLLLILMERSILGSSAPGIKIMYTTIPHLQSAIRLSLQKGQMCRVYKESLDACWPHLSDDAQAEEIAQFAMQHHWVVSFRQLGPLGLVAEFQKADESARVAHGWSPHHS